MKVERKEVEPKFEPIVITLETEEEARLMWAKLNLPSSTAKRDDDGILDGIRARSITFLNTSMWEEFDKVFGLWSLTN